MEIGRYEEQIARARGRQTEFGRAVLAEQEGTNHGGVSKMENPSVVSDMILGLTRW
jgi:hypothetical protein